jgi:tRNA threonylcarbamoyladenosine biosynthesis protein TsaE
MQQNTTYHSSSVADTWAAGARSAHKARPGDVLALCGELGCGKTEFVRGFVAHLAPNAAVRSPSFSLVNTYATPAFPVYHFDFYRLKSPQEMTEIGFEEYLRGDGVCCIEWANLFAGLLPSHAWWFYFKDTGDDRREIADAGRMAAAAPGPQADR